MSFKANDVIIMVSNHQWNVVEITYEYSDNDFMKKMTYNMK